MSQELFYDRNIEEVELTEELTGSYLSYAMSVIVGRALPDIRDGLKPVHRRILYAMHQSGNTSSKPYRKSARIVGDVIGKYHPHGDTPVYDALVRMAQDFSMRYPLVDGQGNFGSVDGDPPAAMRYTEVRMTPLAEEVLKDIEKDTVDFVPNYDSSLIEPVVLPSRIPNLLINGSSGIAVGMATNIPPHNLSEVIDAVVHLIDNKSATVDDILKIIKGPDFPTGAIIYHGEELLKAYRTGKGKVLIRAKALIEQDRKGNKKIVITEIPYGVSKASIIEKIANLVKNKKIEDISALRDESDREGIRIVIELKKDASPNLILNKIYKHTPLETTFGIIFLAIVDGKPKQLNIVEILGYFIRHRREVVSRRTKYELKKAEERAHILEGLKIALSNIDEVVEIIKKSKSTEVANERLRKRFSLSFVQAKAILEMQLQRLTGLEREKIDSEYLELIKKIAYYKELLSNPRLIDEVIKEELIEIKKKYGDERRTDISFDKIEESSWIEFVKEEDFVITYTESGYIKRTALTSYQRRGRATKGQRGVSIKEEDVVKDLFIASSHDYLLLITDKGRAYWLKTIDIPEQSFTSRGKPVVNFIEISKDEKVAEILGVRDFSIGKDLFFVSERGKVKRTPLSEFSRPRRTGITAVNVQEGDRIVDVILVDDEDEIVMFTRKGRVLKFSAGEVRPMGRQAGGVIGMRLYEGDSVLGARKVNDGECIFLASKNGYGKKTKLELFRGYSRGSRGVTGMKITEKTGEVVGGEIVHSNDEVIIITEKGKTLRVSLSQFKPLGRATQGVRLIKLNDDDKVKSLVKVKEGER